MNQLKNYHRFSIRHQPKYADDQEIYSSEDSYPFKTHPSLQCSNFKLQHTLKSQNFIQNPNYHHQCDKKETKTTRNILNHQLQQKLIQTQKQPLSTLKQPLKRNVETKQSLHHVFCKLTKKNKIYQQQNKKLRSYVEFLQDYNYKLKKQLMHSIRRRNIDSSFGYMPQNQKPKLENELYKFLASRNQFDSNENNKSFSTLEAQQNLTSHLIFTSHQLPNKAGSFRNFSFGNNPNHQFEGPNYVSAFYPTNQKPLNHNHANEKMQKKYENIIKNNPSSVQSSLFLVSNQKNPQINSKQINNKKLYTRLNSSFPVNQNINTTHSQYQNNYRSLKHTDQKVSEVKTKNNSVCKKCLKSCLKNGNQKQQRCEKKFAKQKLMNSNKTERLNHSTSKKCVSCNQIKLKKRGDFSKGSTAKKLKPFQSIQYSNQLTQKQKTMHQNKAKAQSKKQKIQTSQFQLQ